MNLAQLRYVVAVDDHRHFSRAAEACRVTQPTLSTQLAKLEAELGVEIFDRSKRPVEPTDLGSLLVAQARTVLRETSRIPDLIREAEGETSGHLRVGVLPTLAPYLLPRFVSELRDAHPRLRLTVRELLTDEIVDDLGGDRLDAGIVATPVDAPGIVDRRLFDEPFVGYVAPGHRLSGKERIRQEDLVLEDLWILDEGHCFRDQVLELCRDVRSPDGEDRPLVFESGSLETLRRLVDQGGGMTLLPRLAADDLEGDAAARIRPFAGPSPARTIRLVHRKTYLKRGLIHAFVRGLVRALPRGLGSAGAHEAAELGEWEVG